MSMTSEELEKTGVLKTVLDKDNVQDEMTVGERIEALEHRLDYIDIDDEKKESIKKLIEEINNEDDEKTKEFLYNHLMKLVD